MIFALTYVPCVACAGMSIVFNGKERKLLSGASLIFGGAAIFSYISFVGTL
tara:strand:+ start:391 stop:543 length:153 start_codon:yes stop_codon:yes gene_type:complete